MHTAYHKLSKVDQIYFQFVMRHYLPNIAMNNKRDTHNFGFYMLVIKKYGTYKLLDETSLILKSASPHLSIVQTR